MQFGIPIAWGRGGGGGGEMAKALLDFMLI